MDFTHSGSKTSGTAVYPVHAQQTSGLLTRCEPMLNVETLKSQFLLGINLVMPNGDRYTKETLERKITWAMNEAELAMGVPILREAFKHKVPFDYALYKSYIHIMAEKGPIISIEQLGIVSA